MASKNSTVTLSMEDQISQKLTAINKHYTEMEKKMKATAKAGQLMEKALGMAAGIVSIGAVTGAVSDAVKTWMEWEKANQKLNAAFTLGAKTNAGMVKDFQKLADSMESVLNIDDKIVMSEAGKLASLGRTKAEIENILKASADLSTALGISFESASDMINKSFSGTASKELKKLIPEIANMSAETLKAGGALEVVTKQFGGMAEAANTGAYASINRLSSSFKNLQTETGRMLSMAAKPFLDWLGNLLGASSQSMAAMNDLTEAFIALRDLKQGMNESDTNFEARRLENEAKKFTAMWDMSQNLDKWMDSNGKFKGVAWEFIRDNAALADQVKKEFGISIAEALQNNGGDLKKLQEVLMNRSKAAALLRQNEATGLRDATKPKLKTFSSFGGGGDAPKTKGVEFNPGEDDTNWGGIYEQKKNLEKVFAEVQKVAKAEKEAKEKAEEWSKTINALQEGFDIFKQFLSPAQDFYGALQELQNATAQNEIDNINKALTERQAKYDSELNLKRQAGEDTTAFELEQTALIEAEKEKLKQKESEFKRKNYEADKLSRLGAVGMKMAEGIMAGIAMGLPLGPAYAAFAGASGAAQIAFINSLPVPEFAMGTNFAPGGLSLVGERGRELVNLPRGSQVIPNTQTEAMLGGQTIVKNYYITGFVNAEMIREIESEKKKLSARGQLV